MGTFTHIKKIIAVAIFAAVLSQTLLFCGCGAIKKGGQQGTNITNGGKLNVVTTIFPQYDFAREIGGGLCNTTMLIKTGAESHTFMPTVEDMVKIEQCDIFICVGGETDAWVESEILPAIDMSGKKVLHLTDMVDLICHDHEHDGECDDHVWTSPVNAKIIVEKICAAMCELDNENASAYETNADNYIQKLTKLDEDIRETVENASRDTVIIGDRFPFAYFAEEYGVKRLAAFEGCSSSSEPTLAVINELVTAVKENNIPVVFTIEFSKGTAADAICRETGAKKLLLHSCHNVTQEEFARGEGYLSLMTKNLENLREALYE